MQFACPACHQVIEHQGLRPRFCQHCGEPLSGTKTDLAEAATLVGPSADGSSATLPDVTQQLGEYRLIRELGRGGMGVVYEAEHADTGRRLALPWMRGEPCVARCRRRSITHFDDMRPLRCPPRNAFCVPRATRSRWHHGCKT